MFAGSALVKCGHIEQKLGVAERDFLQSAANTFLQPLKAFLDGDMKTVQVPPMSFNNCIVNNMHRNKV